MLSFQEVVKRSLNGPICTERHFDLEIFVPNLRKVIQKYGITYDAQNPVPESDDLADRVWEAGMEFLLETGVYCLDTERRIIFTRNEIEGAQITGPRGKVFGEGKEAKQMPLRHPEDKVLPWCSGGGGSSPVSSEWIFLNLVKTYAENPLSDSISGPCLLEVDGQRITAGSPLGVEGTIRAVTLIREALRRAGRPGLPLVNGITTATRCHEHIAGHRFGIRSTDALEIGTVHEMKIDFDSLNKVAFSLAAGSLIFGECGIILGGLSGGPAGVAVVAAAYNPVDILVLRAAVQHPFPVHFDLGPVSNRETVWARSLANQAISRNSSLPIVNAIYSIAGPATKMNLYELSACVIGSVASGGSIEIGGSAKGVLRDHISSLEAIFASEIAHASAGMSRREANKIALKLIERYEDKLRDPPIGQRYQDCFDMATGRPNKEYIELCRATRQEMTEQFGLRFPRASQYI